MRELDVAEAQSRLAELVLDAERGESVAITLDGRTAALLAPAPCERDAVSRNEAIERFLRLCAEWKPANVTRAEILAWRREGLK